MSHLHVLSAEDSNTPLSPEISPPHVGAGGVGDGGGGGGGVGAAVSQSPTVVHVPSLPH